MTLARPIFPPRSEPTDAPGDLPACQVPLIPDSCPGASQAVPVDSEPSTGLPTFASRAIGSALTRRSLMNSIVALPLVGTPVIANTVSFDVDAELIELAARIQRLHEAAIGACRRLGECEERFRAIKPEKPQALIWRFDWDLASWSSHDFVDAEGRRRVYVDFNDVDKLRGREFLEYSFLGSDEEWDRHNFQMMGCRVVPIKGYEHLFSSKPDERRQKRALQLIEALDDHRARYAAAEEQSGMRAAEAVLDEIYREQRVLCKRMLSLKPTSLNGVRALATALIYNCWSGEIEEYSNPSEEDMFLTAIVRSLAEPALVN